MSRYIDVDEEIRKINEVIFEKEHDGKSNEFVTYCFKMFANALSKAPTADVKKVRHAKWSGEMNRTTYYCARCSNCGLIAPCLSYCGMCGAKMDEETKE